MSLRVGIHENVVVNKTSKNERGSLEVYVKKLTANNAVDRLNSSTSSTSFDVEENKFLLFPFKATNYQGGKLDDKQVTVEIANVKDPLHHILSQYMTDDKIKWDILRDTGVNNDNYAEKILQQPVLDKVYANLVDQFITMMKPFVGENGKKLRAVFPRTSKAKHFPALRKKFLDNYPIFESMEIPKEQSKIKFTQYEINNGLNVPDQVTGKQEISKEDAAAVNDLFAKLT